jgi:hypothetical protein
VACRNPDDCKHLLIAKQIIDKYGWHAKHQGGQGTCFDGLDSASVFAESFDHCNAKHA